jgi:hypothetical protein
MGQFSGLVKNFLKTFSKGISYKSVLEIAESEKGALKNLTRKGLDFTKLQSSYSKSIAREASSVESVAAKKLSFSERIGNRLIRSAMSNTPFESIRAASRPSQSELFRREINNNINLVKRRFPNGIKLEDEQAFKQNRQSSGVKASLFALGGAAGFASFKRLFKKD